MEMKINHRVLSKIIYAFAVFLGIFRILVSLYMLYPIVTITVHGRWSGFIAYCSVKYPETLATPLSVILFELRESLNNIIFIVCGVHLIFYRKNVHWRKFIIWGCIITCLLVGKFFDIVYHLALPLVSFSIKPFTFPAIIFLYGFYKRYLYRIHGME